MGELKVLNKYYSPELDPSKLTRNRGQKNQQSKILSMLPVSIRCNTCGNYLNRGTKFNFRKEDVVGETYLGIKKFRFYFKCTRCSAELIIRTDPQNSDYVMEYGATRNFESLLDEEAKKKEDEEIGNAMKALENKSQASKREMEIIAALDELKSLKTRHANVSVDAMLEASQRIDAEKKRRLDLEVEDEALIRSIFHRPRKQFIRRISDEEIDDYGDLKKKEVC